MLLSKLPKAASNYKMLNELTLLLVCDLQKEAEESINFTLNQQ